MTLREYISSKLASLGYTPSEADFLDISAQCDIDQQATADTIPLAEVGLITLIPLVLARPNVSESGFSLNYNSEGLKSYYSLLCRKHGMRDELAPRISFR